MIVPLLLVLSIDDGSWKSVVEPIALTEKTELVAKPAVVGDWMSKSGRSELLEVAAMVRREVGEVVPRPRLPAVVRRARSVNTPEGLV